MCPSFTSNPALRGVQRNGQWPMYLCWNVIGKVQTINFGSDSDRIIFIDR